MIDLTQIAAAFISLTVLLVSTFLIPLIKAKHSNEEIQRAVVYATIGVQAAEQLFKETGMGAQKKAYVEKFLADHGFTLDQDQVDVLIESAVLELKNKLIY